jgi:hypothetical protein
MTEAGGRSFEAGRQRPRWMTFITVLMFLVGANSFVESLDDLHRLASGKRRNLTSLDDLTNPQSDAILRGQVTLDNELFRDHPKVMAVQRSGRAILGLTYLFAVAAVVTRDRRGRRACMLANWFGLAWSVANAAFLLFWVRRILPSILPTMMQTLADDALRLGRPSAPAEVLTTQLVYGQVAFCGLGMVLSLVLLAYFAGRRMRWFYEQSGQVHG